MSSFERTALQIVAVFSCACTAVVATALGRECVSMGLWVGVAEGIIATVCAIGAVVVLMPPREKPVRIPHRHQRAWDDWLEARWRERVSSQPQRWN